MPSQAFRTFRYNLNDVHRLIEAYNELKPLGQGRRGLGHITRSSIVTLCACWEQYIEDLIIGCVEMLRDNAQLPSDLPLQVQRTLSQHVKNAKHELKPLELAGRGWKDLYLAYAKQDVGSLHSPKSAKIDQLMQNYLGTSDPIYDAWTCGKAGLDAFVNARNNIAHLGRASGKYIKFYEVAGYLEVINITVQETENHFSDYLANILPARPWNRNYQ